MCLCVLTKLDGIFHFMCNEENPYHERKSIIFLELSVQSMQIDGSLLADRDAERLTLLVRKMLLI